jgi:hypothetical protein
MRVRKSPPLSSLLRTENFILCPMCAIFSIFGHMRACEVQELTSGTPIGHVATRFRQVDWFGRPEGTGHLSGYFTSQSEGFCILQVVVFPENEAIRLCMKEQEILACNRLRNQKIMFREMELGCSRFGGWIETPESVCTVPRQNCRQVLGTLCKRDRSLHVTSFREPQCGMGG